MDRRVHRVISFTDFAKRSFFERGKFPRTFQNGSSEALTPNPWIDRPNVAPFDQEFYLVLSLQAGGTAGWFPDNEGKKPWIDESSRAMFDFANNTDTWYATWPKNVDDRAMVMCVLCVSLRAGRLSDLLAEIMSGCRIVAERTGNYIGYCMPFVVLADSFALSCIRPWTEH